MARKSLNARQFTLYAKADGDILRWKELRPSTLTLNGWLVELIESSIEGGQDMRAPRTKLNDEIARLKKENLETKLENERLLIRVNDLEHARTSIQLDKSIVDYLKNGGVIKYPTPQRSRPSSTITGDWVILDLISGKTKATTSEPSEDDLLAFKDALHYTTMKIVSKDTGTRTLTVRPSDSAGAGVDGDDHAMIDTLTLLEDWELIEHIRGGWRWAK